MGSLINFTCAKDQYEATQREWAVTNCTPDVALQCDEEGGAANMANVLGTLIAELINLGILKGTAVTP